MYQKFRKLYKCYRYLLCIGGGGHARAAGASIQGNIDQVKEKIMKEVRKALHDNDNK